LFYFFGLFLLIFFIKLKLNNKNHKREKISINFLKFIIIIINKKFYKNTKIIQK